MSGKFSRTTKMQTAPAVCHTPPVAVPPVVPPFPKELECYAHRRITTLGWHVIENFDLKLETVDAPFLYWFINEWTDEPTTIKMEIQLRSVTDLKKVHIDVRLDTTNPASGSHFIWENQTPKSHKPFSTRWYRKMLWPPWSDHQVQFIITEPIWRPPPPKEFCPWHPNVLPF